MKIYPVNPPEAKIPGISQGVIIDGGNPLLLSGHVPMRNDGSVVTSHSEAQLEQVFKNIQETLAAVGRDFQNAPRLRIYVRDFHPDHLRIVRAVRDRYVDPACPPASALIGVASLFHPDVLVEIDAIAAVPARLEQRSGTIDGSGTNGALDEH
ncbi:RidA family protein [Xanthobacter autotrophicus]|uniref:RidA family protein n=1 Tax=Xanthobacter autotrophicus TaxID=280 RepID=UPI0024A6A580|nr:RidA family protein [Xanthobacter autotrophicus]MDI4654989.1 RidA family protein [Xanthobacter autotrophicus]